MGAERVGLCINNSRRNYLRDAFFEWEAFYNDLERMAGVEDALQLELVINGRRFILRKNEGKDTSNPQTTSYSRAVQLDNGEWRAVQITLVGLSVFEADGTTLAYTRPCSSYIYDLQTTGPLRDKADIVIAAADAVGLSPPAFLQGW